VTSNPSPLELRLSVILPEDYHDSYEEDVQPVSMGSAGLRFDANGKVAWNEMWDTFCDLAMAGGPPHKGRLLEPASPAVIAAQPDRYLEVIEEIRRGIKMVTGFDAESSSTPGWVRVTCESEAMAGWLLRAIVIENVAAQADGPYLELPASPAYRLEKEIKNVVTVMAKSCHYWQEHMLWTQQLAIGRLFETLAEESPLVAPALSPEEPAGDPHATVAHFAETIRRDTGLPLSTVRYDGWLGVDCPTVRAAVWMMRLMIASNMLSRREERTLFLPVNHVSDPGGARVASALVLVHRLAQARGLL
jgi:sirohydrochlorin cobaltochelatase